MYRLSVSSPLSCYDNGDAEVHFPSLAVGQWSWPPWGVLWLKAGGLIGTSPSKPTQSSFCSWFLFRNEIWIWIISATLGPSHGCWHRVSYPDIFSSPSFIMIMGPRSTFHLELLVIGLAVTEWATQTHSLSVKPWYHGYQYSVPVSVSPLVPGRWMAYRPWPEHSCDSMVTRHRVIKGFCSSMQVWAWWLMYYYVN